MSLGAAHERARQIAELRVRRIISLSAGRRLRKLNAARRIPHQAWPRAARLSYTLQLRAMLDELEAAIEQHWLPVIVKALPVRLDAAAWDISELSVPDLLEQVIPKSKALRIAKDIADKTSALNKAAVNTQFRSVLGVDLLHHEPYLDKRLALFTADNARLIQALATETANAVHGLALKAARTAPSHRLDAASSVAPKIEYVEPVDALRLAIEARFDTARNRADGMSRDQVGKFNGELTQARQESVGVDEYIWDTSKDERVRADHAALEGTRQRWDDPPLVDTRSGAHEHPGGDFNCRCAAIPVMDDLLRSLGAAEDDESPPLSLVPPPAEPTIEELQQTPGHWLKQEFLEKYGAKAGPAVAWGKAAEYTGRAMDIEDVRAHLGTLEGAGVSVPKRLGKDIFSSAENLAGRTFATIDEAIAHFEAAGTAESLVIQLRASAALAGHRQAIVKRAVPIVLKKPRITGSARITAARAKKIVERARSVYAELADTSIVHPEHYDWVAEKPRAHERPEQTVTLGGGQTVRLKPEIELGKGRDTDPVHEWGHALESLNPKLERQAQEFLERRTKGEAAVPMNDVVGGKRYEPDEITKPDKLFDPYMGKQYKHGATEITSMLTEQLVTEGGLVELLEVDPDSFHFLLGQLKGGGSS